MPGYWLSILLAYLLAHFRALYGAKPFSSPIRASKSPITTNAAQALRKQAALCAVFDALKGAVPVYAWQCLVCLIFGWASLQWQHVSVTWRNLF